MKYKKFGGWGSEVWGQSTTNLEIQGVRSESGLMDYLGLFTLIHFFPLRIYMKKKLFYLCDTSFLHHNSLGLKSSSCGLLIYLEAPYAECIFQRCHGGPWLLHWNMREMASLLTLVKFMWTREKLLSQTLPNSWPLPNFEQNKMVIWNPNLKVANSWLSSTY